jgi:glutathione peroxidase
MFEKLAVNGPERHPLYTELTAVADANGKAGDIEWNFEKFLISADGEVQRFRPKTKPEDPELIAAIKDALP